jgi:hypothetical protein
MENNSIDGHNVTDIFERNSLASLVPEWCRTVLLVYMCTVFIIGLPGNALVIFAQVKTEKKTTTDWFMTFLASSDILTLCVSVPIYSSVMLELWPSIGSTFVCRLHHCVIHWTFIAPTIITAMIAVDRVWKSKSVYQIFTPARALYSCIATCGGTLVVSIAVAFTRHNNYKGQCVRDDSRKLLQFVTYAVLVLVILISVCVIVVSYIRILKYLRTRNKMWSGVTSANSNNNGAVVSTGLQQRYCKTIRTTKLLFIVTVVFIALSVIPSIAAIVLAVSEFRKTIHGGIVLFFTTRLYLMNSCTTPIFYIWLNTAFRTRMLSYLKS